MGVVERGRLPPTLARVLAWGRSSALRVHVEWPDGDGEVPPGRLAARAALDEVLAGRLLPEARRMGVRPASCAAAANVLVVCATAGLDTYHAMPHPKYVVQVGMGSPADDPGPPVDVVVPVEQLSGASLLSAFHEVQVAIRTERTEARWARGPERPGATLGPGRGDGA